MAAKRKLSSKKSFNMDSQGSKVASKRKRSPQELVKAFVGRVGQDKNPLNLEDLGDNDNAILMAAHLQMLEKFIAFCSEKKVKYAQEHVDTTKNKMHEGSNTFKDRIISYFGEYLPSSVVDELCQLVDENSYGKCHYCSLPAESLVLSVLQILLNASENLGSKSHNLQGVGEICINETDNVNPGTKAPPANNAPAMAVFSKSQHNHFTSQPQKSTAPATKVVSPEVYITHETKSKDVCSNLGKLADQIYNQKNVNNLEKKNTPRSDFNQHNQWNPSDQFEVSENEIRYYKVICGLAHSDFRSIEGVKLFKTNVTFSSLGESVEPNGHVDNFFISGYCRKLFDDNHPRTSRKHFFLSLDWVLFDGIQICL